MNPDRRPGRLVLLGHPVSHSLSPAFQNAALHAAGIALRYELLDVTPDALPDTLTRLRADRAAGNVTIPHKEAMHARCERLTTVARRVGAVNTFWIDDDEGLVGDNTDVAGFEAMAAQLGVVGDGCVVACLGSGGAAAAVCAAVEQWPRAVVRLHGRTPTRSRTLAARFGGHVQLAESVAAAIEDADVVVNATPVGLRDADVPVEVARLPRDARVMDLVYRVGETRWVRAARAAGHEAADGREMLLHQGAAAFERWFGIPPDLEAMRHALHEAASA